MTIHKRIEPAPRDRLEKIAKDAIAVAHARSFLSLDNQKVAGSPSCGRACTRVISNRSPDSPASYGGGARRAEGDPVAALRPASFLLRPPPPPPPHCGGA